jgi:hypothetical protein
VFGREKRRAIAMSAFAIGTLVVFAVLTCPSANQGVDRATLSTTGDRPTYDESFYAVQLALAIALLALIGIVVWLTGQRPTLAAVLGVLVTAGTPYAAWVAQSVLYPSAYWYIYPPVGSGTYYGAGLLIAALPFVVPPVALITWLAAWVPAKVRPLHVAGAQP